MSNFIDRLKQIESQALSYNTRHLSAKYKHVSTAALIESMAHLVDVDSGRIKTKAGSFHSVELKLKKQLAPQTYIDGDLVAPTLHVFNSYNGESSLSVYFGLYRFVCQNGLVIGNSLFEAKAKHIEGPKMLGHLERLSTLVNTQLININTLFKQVDELGKHRANQTQVERILDDMRLPFKVYHKALDRFHRPIRQADDGTSAWQVYNRIQEVIADPRRGNIGVVQNKELMQHFLDLIQAEPKTAPKLRIVD